MKNYFKVIAWLVIVFNITGIFLGAEKIYTLCVYIFAMQIFMLGDLQDLKEQKGQK